MQSVSGKKSEIVGEEECFSLDLETVTRVTIEDRFGNDFQTAGGMLHFQYIVYFTHSVNCGVLKSVGHLACNIPALFISKGLCFRKCGYRFSALRTQSHLFGVEPAHPGVAAEKKAR